MLATLALAGCVDQNPKPDSSVASTPSVNTSSSVTTSSSSQPSETVYYEVSFDSAGGNAVDTQRVESGKTANAPAMPTRDATAEFSYEFEGWYLGDTLYDFSTPVTGNIQLVAHWKETKNQYTVTFHYKNASGDTTSIKSYEYGSTMELPETTYTTAEGHIASTDGKWYRDEACTEEANVADPVVANLDLYAKYNALLQHPFVVATANSGFSVATLIQMKDLNLNVASSAFEDGATQLNLMQDKYQYEASAFTVNGEAFTPAGVILHDKGVLQFNFPDRTNAQGDVIKVASGLGFTIDNVHYSLSKDVEFIYNGKEWHVLAGHVDLTYHWGMQGVYMLKGATGVTDFVLSYKEETPISDKSHLVFLKNGEVSSSATLNYIVDSPENGGTPLVKVSLSFVAGDYLTIQGGSYFSDGSAYYRIDHDITLRYVGGDGKDAFIPSSMAMANVQSVDAGDATHVIANMNLPALEGKTLTNQTFPLGDGSVISSSLAYADGKLTVTLPSAASDGAKFSFAKGTKFEADGVASVYFLENDYIVRYNASTGWALYEVTPFSLTNYSSGASNYLQMNQTFDFTDFSDGSALDTSKMSFAVNGEEKTGIVVNYFAKKSIVSITFGSYTPTTGDVFTIKAGSIFTDGKKDYSLREDCNLRYNGTDWAVLTYVDSFQYHWGYSAAIQYNVTLTSSWSNEQSLDMTAVKIDVNGTAQAVYSVQYYRSGIISINFGSVYTPKENDVFTVQAGSVFEYNHACFELKTAISMKYNGSSWVAA